MSLRQMILAMQFLQKINRISTDFSKGEAFVRVFTFQNRCSPVQVCNHLVYAYYLGWVKVNFTSWTREPMRLRLIPNKFTRIYIVHCYFS